MCRLTTTLGALAALFLSGCYVQSLHPFCLDETQIEFPEIEGEWQPMDGDGTEAQASDDKTWVFEKKKILTFMDDVPSEIEVRYFAIDGRIFADWTAGDLDDDAPPNMFWATHVVPTHSVFHVRLEEDALTLTPLDIDWLEKRLREGDLSLSHVVVDDDRRVFTVSSEVWTRFLMEYGDDPEAFDPDNAMHFRWPAEPTEPDPPEVEAVSARATATGGAA